MGQDIFVISAKRTAIGTFGGSLKDHNPSALGAMVTRAALETAGVPAAAVGHVVFGQVIPTAPRDAYLGRIVAIEAGLPTGTPALTVNRLCGSGLQAILTAANVLMLGDAEIAVGGGAEVMSRASYFAPATRFGQKMGDTLLIDGLNGALEDPFHKFLMGITAENVAEKFGISRDAQDRLALESQRRATAAIADGRFASQILPVEVRKGRDVALFNTDEHVRAGTSLEDLARLRPIFRKEGGTVTAGNASGINDGAAALVLATEQAVKDHNLSPIARLVSYGYAGVEPGLMGIGPVPATRIALARAGLSISDMDVIESNEAFAAQACAVAQELGFDPARTNPNGSGISLGHPVGATGAIITTKLLYELQRISARYGLATMCIGGGQGIAAIFEHV